MRHTFSGLLFSSASVVAEAGNPRVLHRADPDDQVAKWVKITERMVSAQSVHKPQGGRPEGGINAAAVVGIMMIIPWRCPRRRSEADTSSA